MSTVQEKRASSFPAAGVDGPQANALAQDGRHGDATSPDSLGAVLDSFAALLCVVGDARQVLYMNRAARSSIDRRDGFVLREGRLHGVRAETTYRLERALKAVRDRRAFHDAFQVQGIDREATLQVSISALANATSETGAGGAVALLTAGHVQGSDHAEATLRRLFGLSKSEAALLKGLLAGKTVEQCAQARGVAISTVRSQLSSIFLKTNTTHQAQLIAVAKALPVTVTEHDGCLWTDGWVMV